jgi:predicted dehydrogenase
MLNTVCWCLATPVREVTAYTDNQDTAVDINSVLIARFEGDVLASLAVGGNCPPDGSHMSFIFDGGRIDFDGWYGRWIRAWRGQDEVRDLPGSDGDTNPNDNFVDAILGRAEPLCDVRHGMVQCALMDAVYASAKSGASVRCGAQAGVGGTPSDE